MSKSEIEGIFYNKLRSMLDTIKIYYIVNDKGDLIRCGEGVWSKWVQKNLDRKIFFYTEVSNYRVFTYFNAVYFEDGSQTPIFETMINGRGKLHGRFTRSANLQEAEGKHQKAIALIFEEMKNAKKI